MSTSDRQKRRRYQRYEIDTELRVAMLGLEQRGTLRGRSLNISEAGIAGVFVVVGCLLFERGHIAFNRRSRAICFELLQFFFHIGGPCQADQRGEGED